MGFFVRLRALANCVYDTTIDQRDSQTKLKVKRLTVSINPLSALANCVYDTTIDQLGSRLKTVAFLKE